jgi:hypothetical protein
MYSINLNLSISSETNVYLEVLLFRVKISQVFNNTDIKYDSIDKVSLSFKKFH